MGLLLLLRDACLEEQELTQTEEPIKIETKL